MLQVTYLGWQSWFVGSERTRLLIDPLLVEEVGRGPAGTRQDFVFWPPRRFHWPAFPSIDAVVLSHEHEDHFSIPSLARIERSVPVYLSARSSIAARTIVREMGFRLILLQPGGATRIGELELEVFTPNHVATHSGDEWDTLGYLIRQAEGHGNFFSNVDIPVSPAMVEAVARAGRGIETLSCQSMSLGLWSPPSGAGGGETASHAPPKEASFAPDGLALETIRRGGRILPLPGQTAVLRDGKLSEVQARSEFLGAAPRSEWGERPAFLPAVGARLAPPLCGREAFPEELVQELESGLARLAEYLYGHILFRHLHSIDVASLGPGCKPTFVLALRAGPDQAPLAYEYQPEGCRFERVALAEGFQSGYLGVIACWAGDLLSLFRGEFEPRNIVKSYREAWSVERMGNIFFTQALWPFFHPLRHPANCLRQYRSMLAGEEGAPMRVALRAAAPASARP